MKFKKLLIIPVLLLVPFAKANASVVHCSAPGQVNLGDTFNVTFSGSLSSSNSTWSGNISSSGNVTYAGGDGLSIWKDGASFSHTVSFTANTVGTASFTVSNLDVSDENQEYSGSDTCSVTIVQPSAPTPTESSGGSDNNSWYNDDYVEQSGNNNLKSLSLGNVKISPEFKSDVQEYSAIVDGKVDKVTISGEVEDDKSSIEGTGEIALNEGINKIEVVVTSENGDRKVYTVNITRKEINPIEVKISNKKYTVLKKEVKLQIPDGYEKTTIKIDKLDVEAFTNKKTKYTLVALVDDKGVSGLYIYDNNTYTKYNEFSSDIKIILLDKKLPSNYKKTTFNIGNEKVEGYYLDKDSNYRIVYGLNAVTGEKDYYQYDLEGKTFQRHELVKEDSKLLGSVLPESFDTSYLVIALGGLLGLSVIVNIILLFKKSNTKEKTNTKDNKKELEKERKEFLDL